MDIEIRPLLDFGLESAVGLLNRGFTGYFVPIELSLAGFMSMVHVDGLDLSQSRVIWQGEQALGVALIARRGWTSRLAGMSLIPEARGQGIGTACMVQLLTEARARGDRSMVLEVIEQNIPAVRLYQGCGFRIERKLCSYSGSFPELVNNSNVEKLQEVDIRLAAQAVTTYGLSNLPWQISGESLAQHGPPNKAYALEGAYIVISDPEARRIAIRGVVVEPQRRNQHKAIQLIRATLEKHPGKVWSVPALCPVEVGGLFEKAGFQQDTLSQLQMGVNL